MATKKTQEVQTQEVQTQEVQTQEKLPYVQKKNIEGTYKVFYVGKIRKVKSNRGDFMSISIGIENKNGKKAWLSLTEADAYKVFGITSARTEAGNNVQIKELKAVKSGTYTNIYFTIGEYVKNTESQTGAVGDLGDFEEILSDGEVPF